MNPDTLERGCPLAATSRAYYYPGFLAALFLVLLRIGIGWHFLYEGLWKYDEREGKPFTAEGYFRASAGPLAPAFRSIVPDYDGLALLERDERGLPKALKAMWSADLDRHASAYGFDATQRASAEKALAAASAEADAWFLDLENAKKLSKYEADLAHVQGLERAPVDFQNKLATKDRQKLNADRKELIATADGWLGSLREAWTKLATPEQAQKLAPAPAPAGSRLKLDFRKPSPSNAIEPMTRIDWLNTLTIYGLIAAGFCLIVGLFTPLAALWCAGFLTLIYLSFPPWPGVPDPPVAEGHYFIVSRNLIELLACLALAFLPTGQWVGLDALLFGWRRRRRLAAELARAEEPGPINA